MTTINLIEKKAQENENLKRIRGLVKSVTTVILVVYIVVTAGFIGWEWWLNDQKVKTQQNLKSVSDSVIAMSSQEVLVRKIDSRTSAIDTFLSVRPDTMMHANNFNDEVVKVVGWDFTPGGIQRVEVTAGEPEQIAEFSKKLGAKYSSVAFDMITWLPSEAWSAVISLGRIK